MTKEGRSDGAPTERDMGTDKRMLDGKKQIAFKAVCVVIAAGGRRGGQIPTRLKHELSHTSLASGIDRVSETSSAAIHRIARVSMHLRHPLCFLPR